MRVIERRRGRVLGRVLVLGGVWVALWVGGAAMAAGEGGGSDAPAWAVGVSVGHPQLVEVSAAWRPTPRLYLGPTVGLAVGFVVRDRPGGLTSFELRTLGASVGGVVGWEWPLGGWHGLLVEASGGVLWPLGRSCDVMEGGYCSPESYWFVGGQVGWYARPNQTTWQVSAGLVSVDVLVGQSSERFGGDDTVWAPTLRLVGQFGL